MRTVLLQLERIRRHYETSYRTYDEVSLMDLSHSLRIWADLKSTVHHEIPAFKTTSLFKSASPPKKLLKISRNRRHVFAYMPDGVKSHAANGQVLGPPKIDYSGTQTEFWTGCAVKYNIDGSIELKNFSWIEGKLENRDFLNLDAHVSRGNFTQWMGAEVVRIGYPTDVNTIERLTITREQMIRRVANTLGGSHPSNGNEDVDSGKIVDAQIHDLLKFSMGGLSVPYLILLKTAQDLLNIVPKLLSRSSTRE